MTRTKHDRFAKELLAGLLDPFGITDIDVAVSSEVRAIDLLFTPQPATNLASLGLLGRIAQTPCIIEPYRNPPTRADLRICVMRLAIYEGMQQREANRKRTTIPEESLPWGWVVSPTLSRSLIESFGGIPDPDWPQGVYFLPKGLRTVLVAVHHLPVVPETLWLRILGRGKVQERAIEELLALPEERIERQEILRLITNWQIRLQQSQEAEDVEMAVQLSQAYLEWEKATLERGIERGIEQGELRGKIKAVPALTARGFSVDEISQILGLTVEQIQSALNPPA
jgi:hypothetical protein